MKNLFIVLFVLIGFVAKAQFPSQQTPTQFSTGWFKQGWHQADSGHILANRSPNFTPRFPGTTILYQQVGVDSSIHYFNGGRWLKLSQFDSTSLSNRINLKLNISDTATMLLPYLRKADTANKWVQDIYVRNDSLFKFKNGAETFLDTLGGGSSAGLTSVGLSLPSAFTVTNSPLTSNGTLNVIGAGTTPQYIRGNGTLATTDTGMIPNFHLKVRSLISGTSPITFNQTTGLIGINNANTSGTKGAATFNSGSFSDNGAGTISLVDIVGAGSCINCDITFDAKGRATSFVSGTPPQFVNAPEAGDTLSRSDTLKRLNKGYGILHAVTDNNITHSVDTSSSNSLVTQYDLSQAANISNTSLTANGNYTQNWNNKQWYVDSIASQFLFRMGGVGNTGTRRKEFRINWGGSSFGDQFDSYNMLASIKKADNSADSLTLGMISNAGVLSVGSYNVAASTNNTFISYSAPLGLINIQAKDSIWIKGATPAATADSILAVVYRSPTASRIVKIPLSAAGGGTTLNNIGTGFAWAATPAGDVKRVANSNTVFWDSTSTANSLTAKVDTSVIATQFDLLANDRLSAKVYYLTKNGAISDADVSVGSSTMGTNNTIVIQAILNNASSGIPIEVVVDGEFSVDSLKIYGGTTLRGLNTGDGIIQRPGINYPMIMNQNRTLGNIVDSNIVIENITLNGNGYNTSRVAQRNYYGTHGWNVIIRFTGSKNVQLNNVRLENGITFASYNSNVKNFIYTNSIINASPYITPDSLIHDGIKFDGPASDIVLSNLKIHSIDDAISLCPNDGFFPTDSIVFGYHTYDPYATFGTIKNVTVENIIFDSCYHGIRMLNSSELLDNITFKGIKGFVSDYLFVLDDYLGNPSYKDGSAPTCGNISFDDIDIDLIPTSQYANAGMLTNIPVTSLRLSNISIRRVDGTTLPTASFVTGANIGTLTLENWLFSETTAAARPIISNAGGIISTLNIDNLKFNRASSGDAPVVQMSSGTLSYLLANGINTTNALRQIKYTGGTATNVELNHANHISGDITFSTTISVPKLVVSNYISTASTSIYGGGGSVASATGDAFQTIAPGYIAIQSGVSGTSELLLYDENQLGVGDAWLMRMYTPDNVLSYQYYNGSTYSNWLNIKPTGEVGLMGKEGIGTLSPTELLHVTGNIGGGSTVGTAVRLLMNNTNTSDGYVETKMTTDISDFRFGTGGTGTTPFGFTAGASYIGTVSNHPLILATNNAVRMSIANSGAITFGTSTNSYTFPTTRASAGQVLTDVSGTGAVTWATPSGATTLYTGDGTVTGNRNVNGNNFNLTFSDVNTFKTSFDLFVQARADGGVPYSTLIDAGGLGRWQLGFTPTAGTFSKGSAIMIDTNNNVGMGTFLPTTAPLYATGNSGFVNGLQSQSGNFYAVANITSNTTIGLTHNFMTIDATSGNITITIPAASVAFGGSMGIEYIFKRLDNSANTITVQRNGTPGTDTIDGGASFTLTAQYESKSLRAISSNAWAIY